VKVALVHDYLNQAGGAERVLEQLHKLFPDAPIYTSILDRNVLWPGLRDADIRTSWMQRLPGILRHHRLYLPFYPATFQRLDLRPYDLVISSSSAFAKAAVARRDARHICYCHAPMRFVWDHARYVARENFGRMTEWALAPVIRLLKRWDVRTSREPDVYIANSSTVARRIASYYGRESEIVFPPVAVDRFAPSAVLDDYYLIVSRLVAYKRIDLAVAAFNELGRPLLIIGDGPDRGALARLARPNVRFMGWLPDADVARYYARCQAVAFPGEEDFGITALEANAAGRPVIAYGLGGALDTVVDGETGVLFREQTVRSFRDAVARCDAIAWNAARLRGHAERFNEAAFAAGITAVVERAMRTVRYRAASLGAA
jgi:glycosyltransferase involved in cell wall biosynthesis